MFYENFMLVLSIDVPVLLNTCGNSEQRSKLVSHQLITQTQEPGQFSLALCIRAPASTHIRHILLRAAHFIKSTIPWKRELWPKIAQRSRSSLKMTPSLFNLYYLTCMILRKLQGWPSNLSLRWDCSTSSAKARCWVSVVTLSLFSSNILQFSFLLSKLINGTTQIIS